MKRNFTFDEIMEVLNKYSKDVGNKKNDYIARNGIDDKVNCFDGERAACISLMCIFDSWHKEGRTVKESEA